MADNEIHEVPADQLSEFARVMGSKGGKTTKDKYGTSHFAEIRKLSTGHWPKGKKRVKNEAKLPIDKRLPKV